MKNNKQQLLQGFSYENHIAAAVFKSVLFICSIIAVITKTKDQHKDWLQKD